MEFKSILMSEAQEIFKEKGDYIILDVRRPDEFETGHIPGALNFAMEEITNQKLDILPDLDMTVYVYCRSGQRSKAASRKLAAIGYSNIIECQGIMQYTGEIEK